MPAFSEMSLVFEKELGKNLILLIFTKNILIFYESR